ncbi:hypothetical protein PoB_003019000 [Plakobranchus ocellatus]|uniref:Uncharacterized protein n=1 Tax=Plakobranchus ocellatus TaxID=259542 RepID=A0AAV4A691_9GAST|nr:hypothetical protein PoB_003019000 [Plakobranchus ocellatus]
MSVLRNLYGSLYKLSKTQIPTHYICFTIQLIHQHQDRYNMRCCWQWIAKPALRSAESRLLLIHAPPSNSWPDQGPEICREPSVIDHAPPSKSWPEICRKPSIIDSSLTIQLLA